MTLQSRNDDYHCDDVQQNFTIENDNDGYNSGMSNMDVQEYGTAENDTLASFFDHTSILRVRYFSSL